MSGPQPLAGATPFEPDPEQLAANLKALKRIAEDVSRRVGIPQERDELVQRACERLLSRGHDADEPLNEGLVRADMRRMAAEMAKRRRLERTNIEPATTPAVNAGRPTRASPRTLCDLREAAVGHLPTGVPPLGERLLRLARAVGNERQMALHVRAAAAVLAQRRSVIQRRQRSVFQFAYIECLPIDEIARLRGTTTGAVTQGLRRVRRRIDRALMSTLPPELDAAAASFVRSSQSDTTQCKKFETNLRPREAVCGRILRALDAVIHSEASDPLT